MAHTAAIMDACEEHGWMLERLIRDANPTSKSRLEQPGLSYALEQLRNGDASRLVVHELDQLALSGTELRMMLGWFLRTGVALSALDVGLDTSTEEGRNAAAELLTSGKREWPAGEVERRRRVSVQSAFGYSSTEEEVRSGR
jgi:DNA invertase Pin-like site-specific DNA recombinase